MRAHENEVELFALTDHDATEGLHEAANAASKVGMKFVAGIELSVTWSHQTIHIVGLGINPDDLVLNQGLKALRDFRAERGAKIAQKLEKVGFENVLEGTMKCEWRI